MSSASGGGADFTAGVNKLALFKKRRFICVPASTRGLAVNVFD